MNALAAATILSCALAASAIMGPALLRRASPVLVRLPLTGALILLGTTILWIVGLLSLGPLLAWAATGPTLLPSPAAEVCQRCISAANPFGHAVQDGIVPPVLLFIIPAAAATAIGANIAARLISEKRTSRQAADSLLAGAQHTTICGYQVTIVDRHEKIALSFPPRRGGIVLSTAALRALTAGELRAVLAHEHAHVRQRHHHIRSMIEAVAPPLTWLPLMKACRDAVPHYLEIAADAAATREVGTDAVVSALVALGDHPAQPKRVRGAMGMAGPERIRHLVAPTRGIHGTVPTAVAVSTLVVLALFSLIVAVPYASAVVAGCL